jgi:MerR family mercuric resistance operon transcriptional regulator
MGSAEHVLTIGALAKTAGLHVETIRYYQRRGLLNEPPRRHGAVRRYGDDDVARLAFIRSAKRLGFSLDEVRELLSLDDGVQCREAEHLAKQRLQDVRDRLAELRRMERALLRLTQACGRNANPVACPLIAALGATRVRRGAALG